jgi:hypothetical protein
MSERDPTPDVPPASAQPSGTPRWVKVLGFLMLLLVLLVMVLHLTENSMGGPGSHLGAAAWGVWRP